MSIDIHECPECGLQMEYNDPWEFTDIDKTIKERGWVCRCGYFSLDDFDENMEYLSDMELAL